MVMPFLRRLLGASDSTEPAGEMSGEPTDPLAVTYPIDRPSDGGDMGGEMSGEPTDPLAVTYPIDRPSDAGDTAGSFFDTPGDAPDGIRESAFAPDTDGVSIGPKHEDPMPAPEGMSSTIGGPGGGQGPDWGDSGAVSIGPKHEDPMPAPEDMSSTIGGPGGGQGPGDVGMGAASIGPKPEDPALPGADNSMSIGPKPEDPALVGSDASASTVVGPGGGGPGDVGTEMDDDGPSTLLDSEGGGVFLQGDQSTDLGSLADSADMDLEGTLEP